MRRVLVLVNKTPSGTENGSVVQLGAQANITDTARKVIVQATLGGTATIKLQGRLSSDCGWVDLKEFTATGADATIPVYPEMRYSITAYTDGAVFMAIGIPCK